VDQRRDTRGYVVAGVPNPLLFTVLTAAFAMLPFGAGPPSRPRH